MISIIQDFIDSCFPCDRASADECQSKMNVSNIHLLFIDPEFSEADGLFTVSGGQEARESKLILVARLFVI